MKLGWERSPLTVSANKREGITYYVFSSIKQDRSRRTKKEEVHSTSGVWFGVYLLPSLSSAHQRCDGEHSTWMCAWQLPSIACLQPHLFFTKGRSFPRILPSTRWERVKTSIGTILLPLGDKRCDNFKLHLLNLRPLLSWPPFSDVVTT